MTRDQALALDKTDPLAACHEAFVLPADTIYLDGNSLGPMPHAAQAAVHTATGTEWAQGLVGAWNDANWIDLPERLGARIAGLIGAGPGDVVCCDSTSINLFKVLAVALSLRSERRKIVSERANFPTDLYMADHCAAMLGHGQRPQIVDSVDALDDQFTDDLAVLMLTHINYRSGAMHDMAELTSRAHRVGALVIWDLAHSAGAVPLNLAAADVDFAIGCGYKYLNGGPGAPAFVYVHPRHQDKVMQPLAGWFGHAAPFAFEPGYRAATGIRSFLAGTPPVLSMRALEGALSVWEDVDMGAVRAKSIALCELFIAEVEGRCDDLELVSPRNAVQRGSQVSFRHDQAYAVMQALIARGVIGDMRAPDILRFGFAPLYIRYVDAFDAAQTLRSVLAERLYESNVYQARARVT